MKAFFDKVIQKNPDTNPVMVKSVVQRDMIKHKGWDKIMKGVIKS